MSVDSAVSESTAGDSAAADNDGDLLIRAEAVTLDLDAEPLTDHRTIVFQDGDLHVWRVALDEAASVDV